MSLVDVGVQTVIHVPNQDNELPVNCEGCVGHRCGTVKLEPTWTSTFLREQWEADSDLKVINRWKEVSKEKLLWEDVSPQSCAVKTLWSQWEWLFFRNSVLCHKWESG